MLYYSSPQNGYVASGKYSRIINNKKLVHVNLQMNAFSLWTGTAREAGAESCLSVYCQRLAQTEVKSHLSKVLRDLGVSLLHP